MLFLHTYVCILDLISDSFLLLLLQFKIAPWRNLMNKRGMWGCLKEFACKDGCGGKQEREGMGLMGFSQSRCLQEPGWWWRWCRTMHSQQSIARGVVQWKQQNTAVSPPPFPVRLVPQVHRRPTLWTPPTWNPLLVLVLFPRYTNPSQKAKQKTNPSHLLFCFQDWEEEQRCCDDDLSVASNTTKSCCTKSPCTQSFLQGLQLPLLLLVQLLLPSKICIPLSCWILFFLLPGIQICIPPLSRWILSFLSSPRDSELQHPIQIWIPLSCWILFFLFFSQGFRTAAPNSDLHTTFELLNSFLSFFSQGFRTAAPNSSTKRQDFWTALL